MPVYSFEGKVFVVTGGARGQGLSHSLALAKAGAQVVAIDFSPTSPTPLQYPLANQDEILSARKALENISSRNTVIDCNLADIEDQKRATECIRMKYEAVDGIINNAGVNVVKDFDSTTLSDWDAIHNINLRAPFFFTQMLVPHFRSSGGPIVFISSLTAIKAVPRQAAYAASKAGLLAVVRGLAVELGVRGIRVNAICSSLVVSPQSVGLTRAARLAGEKTSPPSFGLLANAGPLRPEDITGLVLWLVSDGAQFMTGQAIVLDGGRSL